MPGRASVVRVVCVACVLRKRRLSSLAARARKKTNNATRSCDSIKLLACLVVALCRRLESLLSFDGTVGDRHNRVIGLVAARATRIEARAVCSRGEACALTLCCDRGRRARLLSYCSSRTRVRARVWLQNDASLRVFVALVWLLFVRRIKSRDTRRGKLGQARGARTPPRRKVISSSRPRPRRQ